MDYNLLAELLYPNVTESIETLLQRYPTRNVSGEAVRFAPSPTGYLHIGSFFQAFLNRLIADSTGGVFYFRLEDTDQKRYIAGADKVALEMLRVFGVMPDEGYTIGGNFAPYVQSERLAIYNVFAKQLVKLGRAYPCFCGENDGKAAVLDERESLIASGTAKVDPCKCLGLDEIKLKLQSCPFALKFISNGNAENKLEIYDEIKGNRKIGENEFDAVLIKSNGIPVYAFAHIVDDTLMRTSLVVRGEEWFSTLNLHLQLFSAFGLPAPKYAHTPLLMKNDATTGNKRKISKRYDAEADMRYFLEQGYPTDSVLEYLLTLLNSAFENWRIANPTAQLVGYKFSLKNVGTSNPYFDIIKLDSISKQVISRLSPQELYDAVRKYAEQYDKKLATILSDKDKWVQIFSIDRIGNKPRKDISKYSIISTYFHYFLPEFIIPGDVPTNVPNAVIKQFLKAYLEAYTVQVDNNAWFEHLKTIALESGFGSSAEYKLDPNSFVGDISEAAKILRYVITGETNTPTLYEIMKVLGEHELAKRLKAYIDKIN